MATHVVVARPGAPAAAAAAAVEGGDGRSGEEGWRASSPSDGGARRGIAKVQRKHDERLQPEITPRVALTRACSCRAIGGIAVKANIVDPGGPRARSQPPQRVTVEVDATRPDANDRSPRNGDVESRCDRWGMNPIVADRRRVAGRTSGGGRSPWRRLVKRTILHEPVQRLHTIRTHVLARARAREQGERVTKK